MIHIEMPENASSMVTLNFSGKNLCSFNDIKKFKNLIELDLSENNFKFPIPNLNNLKFLKRLNLAYNQISEFWSFPESLEILVLSSNLISSLNGGGCLEAFKHLSTLDLSYNMLCDVSPLADIVTLKYLFLKSNHIIKTSPLLKLPSLTELDLESNSLSDPTDLQGWSQHASLCVLSLKGNPILSSLDPADLQSFLPNLPFVQDHIFSRSSKQLKNSTLLFNNTKKGLTNKSMINRSLMQIKQENNSSFTETLSSEDEPILQIPETNGLQARTLSNLETDIGARTPINQAQKELIPARKKIKRLFLNTSLATIQNNTGARPGKSNGNKDNLRIHTLDQNLSLAGSIGLISQKNQSSFEASQPILAMTINSNNANFNNNHDNNGISQSNANFSNRMPHNIDQNSGNNSIIPHNIDQNNNNNNKNFSQNINNSVNFSLNNHRISPIILKKTGEKPKNEEKNGFLFKKHEKKNLSALIGKDEEEITQKQTTESLLRKNHQLQIENYNLRKGIAFDKFTLAAKIKRLHYVIKARFDKGIISSKTVFEARDLDPLTDLLETHWSSDPVSGLNIELKSTILHQFDNLRDYYRRKIEGFSMKIGDLESQIAFQIKPLVQSQQQSIEFLKSRLQNTNKGPEKANNSNKPKHERAKSLNYSKKIWNLEAFSNTEGIKGGVFEGFDIFEANREKMRKYVDMLRSTVLNMTCEVGGLARKRTNKTKEKEHNSRKPGKKLF